MADEVDEAQGAGDAEAVRAVFEAMPMLMVAVEGPDHVLVAGNRLYRAFAGRSAFLGRPAREVFPDIAGQQLFELLDQVYACGEPVTAREWRLQMQPAADEAPVEVYVDFSLVPWVFDDGTVRGILITQSDVTERVRQRRRDQERTEDAERRYQAARDVVADLQKALLPTALPVLPGVRVAASYLLANADTAAGGDWFDAFALPDRRVALIVGDVVGHGVAASATMGQLRVVLHERLAATGQLAEAMDAVDRLATVVPGARAATVCAVVFDATTGQVFYCTAGHPPPLVLSSEGAFRYLATTGSGPLGVGSQFALLEETIAPAEMLLLYTDGILERPGRDVPASTVELAQVAANAAAGKVFRHESATAVDRLTTQTLEVLTRETGHSDDITLLAAARTANPPALQLDLPADSFSIALARSALAHWVDQLTANQEDRVALDHAVVELVTNAYEHAPPDPLDRSQATIAISAELRADGRVRLAVADNGRWREPVPGHASPDDSAGRRRGFGLAMTTALVDDLAIDRTDAGTTVTVQRALSEPARLLTSDHFGHERPERTAGAGATLRIVEAADAPSDRITVHGPLDASNVEDLGSELDRRTHAGTRELVVDLTAVTHLASAAVAELHRSTPTDRGNLLRLYAPAGSTAHHVLSLVNLPHITADPHAEAGNPD